MGKFVHDTIKIDIINAFLIRCSKCFESAKFFKVIFICNLEIYTVGEAKAGSTKNVLLSTNPQFLPNSYETL